MGNIDLDGVEDVFEDEEDGPPPIKLGICAMAKKTKSKPMGEIIKVCLSSYSSSKTFLANASFRFR